MLRGYPKIKFLILALDILCIFGAAFLALYLRYELQIFEEFRNEIPWKREIIAFYAGFGMLFLFIFWEMDLYKHRLFLTAADQLVAIVRSLTYGFLVLATAFFLVREHLIEQSRGNVALFLGTLFASMVLVRILLLRNFLMRTRHFNPRERSLVIGAGSAGEAFAASVVSNPSLGIEIIGFLDDDPAKQGKKIMGQSVLGRLDDIETVVAQADVRQLFVAINAIEHAQLLEIVERARNTGLPVTVTSYHFRVINMKNIDTGEFDFVKTVRLNQTTTKFGRMLKRAIDFCGATLLVTMLAPLFAVIAIIIKRTSPGPVFYMANAIGKDGTAFQMFKFRTMTTGSDTRSHRDLVQAQIKSGTQEATKLTADPRITRIGAVLRRYSLDEFPQLFNVLRGEMSLIGPRPCLPYEYDVYEDWHKRRLSVLPGMSGLWQVTGRNEVSFNDMIILDLYYIENYSIWLDFKIFIKTFSAVILGRGGA